MNDGNSKGNNSHKGTEAEMIRVFPEVFGHLDWQVEREHLVSRLCHILTMKLLREDQGRSLDSEF